ncbi:hypothetical protein [Nonomuraea sp. NPDC049400]|uniref:hypothetical protein n=1 Tax=Nonomuraea sp. NPDC049400 TaxID=3364352 RepID=UPI00379A752C
MHRTELLLSTRTWADVFGELVADQRATFSAVAGFSGASMECVTLSRTRRRRPLW